MRTEQFVPKLSNRDTRDQWLKAGALDTWQRASEYTTSVLNTIPENVLPEETRDWIKENIPAIRPFIME